MYASGPHQRSDLLRIDARAMAECGEPELSGRVLAQRALPTGRGRETSPEIQDLTGLLWRSIDNDDSQDPGQLTACQILEEGAVRPRIHDASVP